MAKGKAMGLWKGKVGSNVFYKIKNSNNAQKQGIRERIYDVANPQSNAQATQRMKLNPANRLAAALKSIIERGFEGVKYGTMSRQAFMKYALAMNSGYPYVPKDNSIIYPGSYLISRGSLPEIKVSFDDDNEQLLHSGLKVTEGALSTIGTLSQSLLDYNAFLNDGDQITIVYGLISSNSIDAPIVWSNRSFYLDVNDTTELMMEGDLYFTIDDSDVLNLNTDSTAFAAAAIIISRESSSGGHLRSNATLVYNSIYATLFTDAAYEEARQTYQKKNSGLNSDWPTVDDGGEGGDTSAPIIMNKLKGYDCAQHQDPRFFIGIHTTGEATVMLSVLTNMSLTTSESEVFNEEDIPFLNANVRKLTAAEAESLRAEGYTIANVLVGE